MATKRRRTGDLSSSSSSLSPPASPAAVPPEAAVAAAPESVDEDDVADLLDLLSRGQLIDLLRPAAAASPSLLAEIRLAADRLPAHRNLFVHGVDFSTTTAALTAAFAAYGEIEDCRIVTDRFTGRSKGYGFVLFRHRSAARLALAEPRKLIDGRMTYCQLASSGNINPNPNPNPNTSTSTMPGGDKSLRKIFVGNVQFDVNAARLREFFAQYGEIEEGPFGFDRQTGKCKGYALIVYRTTEEANRALEEPYKVFEGRQVHCRLADSKVKAGIDHASIYAPPAPVHWSREGFGASEGVPPGFNRNGYEEPPPGYDTSACAVGSGGGGVPPPPGLNESGYGSPPRGFNASGYDGAPPGFSGAGYRDAPPGFNVDGYGGPMPGFNGDGYGRPRPDMMTQAARQAVVMGQGMHEMGAALPFGQVMQPNPVAIATMLMAAAQNPAAFGVTPAMLASVSPAFAAMRGPGGMQGIPPSAAPSAGPVQGYESGSAGYQNAGSQGPPGFSDMAQQIYYQGREGVSHQGGPIGHCQMANPPAGLMGGYGPPEGPGVQHHSLSSSDPSNVFFERKH